MLQQILGHAWYLKIDFQLNCVIRVLQNNATLLASYVERCRKVHRSRRNISSKPPTRAAVEIFCAAYVETTDWRVADGQVSGVFILKVSPDWDSSATLEDVGLLDSVDGEGDNSGLELVMMPSTAGSPAALVRGKARSANSSLAVTLTRINRRLRPWHLYSLVAASLLAMVLAVVLVHVRNQQRRVALIQLQVNVRSTRVANV